MVQKPASLHPCEWPLRMKTKIKVQNSKKHFFMGRGYPAKIEIKTSGYNGGSEANVAGGLGCHNLSDGEDVLRCSRTHVLKFGSYIDFSSAIECFSIEP